MSLLKETLGSLERCRSSIGRKKGGGGCTHKKEGMLKKSVHGTQMDSSVFSRKQVQLTRRQTEKVRITSSGLHYSPYAR